MKPNTKVVLAGLAGDDLVKFFPGPPARALVQRGEDGFTSLIDLMTGDITVIHEISETKH